MTTARVTFTYLAACRDDQCVWYRVCPELASSRSPTKYARQHATQHPGHTVVVLNMSRLSVVTYIQVTPISGMEGAPF